MYGLEEDDRLSTYIHVGRFINDYLELDPDEMNIENCDRLGRHVNNSQYRKKRPILVEFRYKEDVEACIRKAYKLSGTRYAIDRDYPAEIQHARKKIWPEYKRLRHANNRSAVKFLYPAGISVNGVVQTNEFPGWDRYVNRQIKVLPQASSIHEPAQINPPQQQGRDHALYTIPQANQSPAVTAGRQTSSQQTTPKVVHDTAADVNPGVQSQPLPPTRSTAKPIKTKPKHINKQPRAKVISTSRGSKPRGRPARTTNIRKGRKPPMTSTDRTELPSTAPGNPIINEVVSGPINATCVGGASAAN